MRECTAGARGEKAGEPLSPEAFFQATRANFETTPSVTDRDVNMSVPKQSRIVGTPLLPKSTHLAALHGGAQLGWGRRAGGGFCSGPSGRPWEQLWEHVRAAEVEGGTGEGRKELLSPERALCD